MRRHVNTKMLNISECIIILQWSISPTITAIVYWLTSSVYMYVIHIYKNVSHRKKSGHTRHVGDGHRIPEIVQNTRQAMGPFQIAIAPWKVVSQLCLYAIFFFKRYIPSLPYIIFVPTCGTRSETFEKKMWTYFPLTWGCRDWSCYQENKTLVVQLHHYTPI